MPPHGDGPIRSDGIGYYIYLPAVFIDHDLSLRRTASRPFAGHTGNLGSLQREPNGRLLDQYGIGEAVMMAPFFGAGEAIAVATGASRDGFSWPFEAAAAFAGFFYALAGLLVLGSLLRRWFQDGTVVVALLAIPFGTDLFSYATYDATFSHAYSFFLVAVTLRLALSIWQRPHRRTALALGVSLGLIGLVRPTNLTVIALCALVGVERGRDLRGRVAALVRHGRLVALAACAFALTIAPQLAYWHSATGHFLVDAYPPGNGQLHLLHPHLVGVLFSVRKGLFFWSPLLVLAVLGLAPLRSRVPQLFLASIAYLAVDIWVVSCWSIWWYGGSFGMRALIEAFPVFALGLAALVDACRGSAQRLALQLALAVTIFLSLHATLAYWQGRIPEDRTTFQIYLDSY